MSNRGLSSERRTDEIRGIIKLYLIVGIDPGTTTGIAALDFDGNPVDVFSSKDLGLDKTIEYLISLGNVSMIATDVNPTPHFVSKLSAQLGSVVFTPPESLSVNEKIFITKGYKVENSHQRDALAAALTAFNKFRNKFQKIDSLKLGIAGDEVKRLVLHGLSISKAQKKLEDEKERGKIEIEKIIQKEKPIKKKLISEEENKIKKLEKQNLILRKQIYKKEEEIKRLRNAISKIKKRYDVKLKGNVEIRKRELSIRNLEYRLDDVRGKLERVEKLKKLWQKAANGEILPISIFPEQTTGLVWIKRRLKKKDLNKLDGIEIAFTDDPINMEFLMDKEIITVNTKYLSEVEGCGYVYARDIAKIRESGGVKATKKISLEEIIEGYRESRD